MAGLALVPLRNIRPRFFEALDRIQLKTVMSAGRQRKYLANSVISNQDHPADHFYLLTSGRARYFFVTPDGRKTILLWLSPGDIFGAAALLARPSEYLVSTEVVKPSSLLVWDRST